MSHTWRVGDWVFYYRRETDGMHVLAAQVVRIHSKRIQVRYRVNGYSRYLAVSPLNLGQRWRPCRELGETVNDPRCKAEGWSD